MAHKKRRRTRPRGPASDTPQAARKDEPTAQPQILSTAYDDGEGNVLVLRGSLTVGSRRDYAQTLAGEGAKPAASREDAWHRAVELLFERLALRWEIAGAPIERQRELLARFRVADARERDFVVRSLRAHCAEWFPELDAP